MKRQLQMTLAAFLTLAACSSCVDSDKNLYEDTRIPITDLFDFKTKAETNFVLNYGFEGYSVPFEIYTSNPLDDDGLLIENIAPIYAAFTDDNTSFSGNIELPAHLQKVYLYSDAIAIPRLIELDVVNGVAQYLYKPEVDDASTRNISYENDCISIGSSRTTINVNSKLYALYSNYTTSGSNSNKYIPSNSSVSKLYSTVSNNTKISANSTLGQLVTRISNTLRKRDNSFYCSDSKNTNLRIANYTEAGEKVEAAHIDLVFISASGGYHNAMGYYYYKSDAVPTAAEIKALPKFLVFPRTTNGIPSSKIKARLQFFGESYDENGVDHFPPGYTIGWMLIADIAGYEHDKTNISSSANISIVNNRINLAYTNGRAIYSDKEANMYQNYGCVTLTDHLSEKIVIGFEDQAFKSGCGDKSYEDILFYVDCDPIAAVFDPERPETSDKPVEEEVFRSQSKTSTLAYEDIWPSGGDYDMNDVVVELTNTITFNNFNRIKRIETVVKPVHNGAVLENAFGFIINGEVGDVVEEESSFFTREENNQFIFFDNISVSMGETFKLVRTFGTDGTDKLSYDESYNPFIVVSYSPGLQKRKDVHLPKNQPSPWIDPELVRQFQDLYFIDRIGLYPFAIELFDIANGVVVSEKEKIGSEGEYPRFKNWVESNGTQYQDWYLYKN